MANIIYHASRVPVQIPFPGSPDTKSLNFDGITQQLINATPTSLGTINAITITSWIKPNITSGGSALFFHTTTDPGADNIYLKIVNGFYSINFQNSTGAQKQYNYNTTSPFNNPIIPLNVWSNVTVTWDGTNVKTFGNSQELSPNKVIDNPITMNDIIGQTTIGDSPFTTIFYAGLIHSTAAWNVVLTVSEINRIYNMGNGTDVDLRFDSGSYISSTNLQHYWRHGFNAANIGEDLGNASTLIDVGNDALNITSADIVTDSPL